MQESRPQSSGPGEAHGTSSEPPDDTSAEEPTQGGAETEIPLGVPVDEAELRRLKEEARTLERSKETEGASAQDESEDEPDGEERGQAEDAEDAQDSEDG